MFSQDSDRHIFTDLLGALDRDFGVQTHAFCLMENHYHLLLRSTSGELSAAMQHLSANFTRHVNHRRGTDGPIFRGRFHSVSVDRDEQLREVCRYVHRNPVDAGFGGRLERYRWSSLGAYLGRRPVPHFLHVDGACPPPTSPGCVAGRRRRSAPAPPERRLLPHDPHFANRIATAAERLDARRPTRPDEPAA